VVCEITAVLTKGVTDSKLKTPGAHIQYLDADKKAALIFIVLRQVRTLKSGMLSAGFSFLHESTIRAFSSPWATPLT
jgi:hypothetical protein